MFLCCRNTRRRSRVPAVTRTASSDLPGLPGSSLTTGSPGCTTPSWTGPTAPAASPGSPAQWPGASTAQTSSVRTVWWRTRLGSKYHDVSNYFNLWKNCKELPLRQLLWSNFVLCSSCTALRAIMWPRWVRSPATPAVIMSRYEITRHRPAQLQ